MTDDDIALFAAAVNAAYPEKAALVTYTRNGDTLTLSYPEHTEEYLISSLENIGRLVKEYILSLVENNETESEDEKKTVAAGTFSYKGIESEVKVYSTYAVLTIPEGVTDDDIALFAAAVNAAYPEEAALVTYTRDGDTLTLSYPEQTDEYLLEALSAVKEGAEYLIDIYSGNNVKEEQTLRTNTVTGQTSSKKAEQKTIASTDTLRSETVVAKDTASETASQADTVSEPAVSSAAPAAFSEETQDSLWRFSFRLNGGMNAVFGKNIEMKGILFAGVSAEYVYNDRVALYGSLSATFPSPFFITADVGVKAEGRITKDIPLNVGVSAGLALVPVLKNKLTVYAGLFTSFKLPVFDINLEFRYGTGNYAYIGLYGSYKF